MDSRLPIIKKIAKAMNEANVRYAIGGSALLYLKGIDFSFNDLDIMVHEEDVEKAKEVLKSLGEYRPNDGHSSAKIFEEFTVEGLDVDLISGFVIKAFDEEHDCSFKEERVERKNFEGVNLALDSLDAWYEIYNLQGRVEKARYIKDYQLYHK